MCLSTSYIGIHAHDDEIDMLYFPLSVFRHWQVLSIVSSPLLDLEHLLESSRSLTNWMGQYKAWWCVLLRIRIKPRSSDLVHTVWAASITLDRKQTTH